jgi:hypothetical protein
MIHGDGDARQDIGDGPSMTLVKKCAAFNAELAEHAEKPWEFFSAGPAVSAFNVLCSHAL